jgi:hypothetical protein
MRPKGYQQPRGGEALMNTPIGQERYGSDNRSRHDLVFAGLLAPLHAVSAFAAPQAPTQVPIVL